MPPTPGWSCTWFAGLLLCAGSACVADSQFGGVSQRNSGQGSQWVGSEVTSASNAVSGEGRATAAGLSAAPGQAVHCTSDSDALGANALVAQIEESGYAVTLALKGLRRDPSDRLFFNRGRGTDRYGMDGEVRTLFASVDVHDDVKRLYHDGQGLELPDGRTANASHLFLITPLGQSDTVNLDLEYTYVRMEADTPIIRHVLVHCQDIPVRPSAMR